MQSDILLALCEEYCLLHLYWAWSRSLAAFASDKDGPKIRPGNIFEHRHAVHYTTIRSLHLQIKDGE